MEVVQGKSKDRKIVIAQEIAFAKVLAGNNKTLRDRAVKKLKKWLTVRGNGKWAFTEDEFLRIWTGLFYCMWMSDKFLIQEELAESISSLIHCFKKNSDNALMFIKCFNRRILLDWEGLDQYRIDKFNMLIRRLLRQTFVYCKEKNWNESFLHKLMNIFYNVVLHRDNSLGFVLHFISIYAEELAKVSKGKLQTKTVLTLIEPFVKLLARSKDNRIRKETDDFFHYLMRQTDKGIEFEEKFNAWKEQGYPGEGPHCMKINNIPNEKCNSLENGYNSLSEEDDDELNDLDQPLDPRAGSVHVFLPQIPIDIDGIIHLFKIHQNSKNANVRGRRSLKSLIQKFEALKRGKFPVKIKKDPILVETKKKKLTVKNALDLLKFTQRIDQEPIKTKELKEISKELEKQNENADDNEELNEKCESKDADIENKKKIKVKHNAKKNNNSNSNNSSNNNNNNNKKNDKIALKKENSKKKNSIMKKTKKQKILVPPVEETKENGNLKITTKKKNKQKNCKRNGKNINPNNKGVEVVIVQPKKRPKIDQEMRKQVENIKQDFPKGNQNTQDIKSKTGGKRKILSNWQVQELDTSSPEYYKIKTQKIIRLEKKISDNSFCEENKTDSVEGFPMENKWEGEEETKKDIFPVFWEKAKEKVNKKSKSKSNLYMNPFAKILDDSKSPSRRISFALEKNMAQENEEYLEEVKNSSKVPFDGSKKPIQSALKSGLAPSPVNPFYRFKKIRF